MLLTLTSFSINVLSQPKIDRDIIGCVTETYDTGKLNIKKTLYDFEDFLVSNKYLSDKSGESYMAVYEKISNEGDVNIELGDFNDRGHLKKSPAAFFDYYRTRIPKIPNFDSR